MNVTTITEPRWEARERLKAYRTALHRKADTEYQQVEMAYRELARGRALLSLTDAFALAPLDLAGRVRLAIARADKAEVQLSCFNHGWVFRTRWGWSHRGPEPRDSTIRMADARGTTAGQQGYALRPLIPPEVRGTHDISRCHVLWEVEQWAEQPQTARPDRDPMLVRRIGDDLWVVLGEWELTEVERAIMQGRPRT